MTHDVCQMVEYVGAAVVVAGVVGVVDADAVGFAGDGDYCEHGGDSVVVAVGGNDADWVVI